MNEQDERLGVPSASGIERIALCPGSWNAEKGLPDKSNADADKGTRIHAMLEDGEIPDDADDTEAEDAERIARLENELLESMGFGNLPPLIKEERLIYHHRLRPVFTGKPDKVYYRDGEAIIIDYKTGRGDYARASRNKQLITLAVLFAKHASNEGVKLDRVYFAIIQPYAKKREEIEVGCLDIATDYMPAIDKILGYINAALQPDAPRIAGPKQCQWCRFKDACPEAMESVKESITIIAQGIHWEMLSPEDKAECYDLASMAEKWAGSVKARLREDLEAGLSVPGLTLKEGATTRVIDPISAQQLAADTGVPPMAFAAACKIKITDFEKMIKGATQKTAKEVKALIEASCEITKKQNKPTVTRTP